MLHCESAAAWRTGCIELFSMRPMTRGLAGGQICGKRVYGPEKKGGGLPSMSDMKPPMPQAGNFGNPVLTLETCQKDLAEAIANEDFLCE